MSIMKHSQYFSHMGVEHSPRQDFNGFTLAEVLITLGIIGVVAAMTIPTLIQDYNQRSWNTGATVFNRKLGEALKVMNSQSSLAGFATTQDFVNELSKHIKITNTCDSDELTNCFTSEIFTTGDTIDTTKLKEARNLNSSGNYGTETIGVQFADGVTALVAYNPRATQDPYSNQVVNVTGSGKSVGLGTDALAILYDVSGAKSPNFYGSGKDVRGINVAIKTDTDFLLIDAGSYSPIECSMPESEGYEYCDDFEISHGIYSAWAGAKYACDKVNMRLPSLDELKNKIYSERDSYGLPDYGYVWADSLAFNGVEVMGIFLGHGGSQAYSRDSRDVSVVCVAN